MWTPEIDDSFALKGNLKAYARRYVGEGDVIAVKFGLEGWRTIFNEYRRTRVNPTAIFLNMLIPVLEGRGYGEMRIARWIFEESIDQLVAYQLWEATIRVKCRGEVPKWIILPALDKY